MEAGVKPQLFWTLNKYLIGLLTIILIGTLGYAQKQNSEIGAWKLNVAKSKYDPGPPPKEVTVKFEPEGDRVKITVQGTDAEAKPISVEYIGKYDGKDYPVKGSATSDALSQKRIDDRTVEMTTKKNGKVVSKSKREVSKDGKTMTVSSSGTDPKGQKYSNVAVYDKQ